MRRRWRRAAGIGLVGCVCAAVPASAAVGAKPVPGWGTNGRVMAIAQIGGTTYLGGSFTQLVDPATGSTLAVTNLAALDSSGNPISSFRPVVNGAVKALASDGTYLYAGGSFTSVDGSRRQHLAKLDAAGALLWLHARTNREVDSLLVSGGVVYGGGTFTKANAAIRNDAAAYAAAGSALLAWNPNAGGRVGAIVQTPAGIVVGGFFTKLGGSPAAHLGATDPTSGAIRAWPGHPA